MGRARTQIRAAALGSSFNDVLGRGRGSAAAHARRDANDQVFEKLLEVEEEMLLEAKCQQWFAVITDTVGSGGIGIVDQMADALVAAYREHAPVEETAEKLRWQWNKVAEAALAESNLGRADTIYEIMVLAEIGDPVSWPGLTTPAVLALTDFFLPVEGENVDARLRQQCEQAVFAIEYLFDGEHNEEHYLRFAKTCEALEPLLTDDRVDLDLRVDMGRWLTQAICLAPENALVGPLNSWIEACAQLMDDEILRWGDCGALGNVVGRFEPASEAGLALAPLAQALARRDVRA